MQNARMAEAMDVQNVAQTPQPTYGAVASHCPECNATLMANTTFCPNCGISLTPVPKSSGSVHTPDSTPSMGRIPVQQGRMGSADSIVTSVPQNQQTPRAYTPAPTPRPSAPSGNATSSMSPSPWSTAPVTPPTPASNPKTTASTVPQQQVMQQQKPSGFTISTGLVIVILIVLIILIIIMIVLIVSHIQLAMGPMKLT
jgi:cobalamin biosynthesis Mg chelatase CobN